eukprot:1152981-Pelagomonas_calceolata.AAC.5
MDLEPSHTPAFATMLANSEGNWVSLVMGCQDTVMIASLSQPDMGLCSRVRPFCLESLMPTSGWLSGQDQVGCACRSLIVLLRCLLLFTIERENRPISSEAKPSGGGWIMSCIPHVWLCQMQCEGVPTMPAYVSIKGDLVAEFCV